MNTKLTIKIVAAAVLLSAIGLLSLSLRSDPVFTAGAPPTIAQRPLYVRATVPPLNMLVMGKDHKIYYEAYNDASDLNGDGSLDVGYRGWELKSPAPTDGSSVYKIDYYGYFNSFACYTWDGAKFVPQSATANKQCSGQWSGDFLNYLTTSRMDALRRVLYGGWRQVDSTTETVLQGAFFPQDAHSWGKEYQSTARDGYNIANYAPLSAPTANKYHLFAVTTVANNTAPLFRVMQNSDFRVWNWLSIEGPVAGNNCFNSSNSRVACVGGTATWSLVPASSLSGLAISTWKRTIGAANPADVGAMNTLFADNAVAGNLCGNGTVADINKPASGNPFLGNGCTNDNYLTRITGDIVITTAGTYRFAVDGDDAVDLTIDGIPVAAWYGGHGNDPSDAGLDSHSGSIALTAGTHTIRFRHEEGGGGDSWGLFWQNTATANRRDDYAVRVQTCPATAALREATCKAYPNSGTPIFKPTGILHDYGENQRMYFGLITGSQRNNLQGGVMRRNVSNFADEIDPVSGVFRTNVDGIARTIDRFRMIGGGYGGGVTNNLNSDQNWNWGNAANGVGGNCESQGHRVLNNGECRMWGNPIAEMMYESLRYFAGAEAATPEFSTTGGSTEGTAEDTALGLTSAVWKDPYKSTANGGLGYPACARPFQTVISDINPSYDGDLPGSAFTGAVAPTGFTPASIAGFSAATQGQGIWNHEFGGTRSVFIGEVAGVTDGAPTAKSASSFGNIRGLAPEEPTKGGSHYSSSVGHYGRVNDINGAVNAQNLNTYSIALTSPLPRITFPVGATTVTLLPFAKTVSGTFGGPPTQLRKPTNTIVDFYVEEIVNLPGGTFNAAVNGGRPYAVFRINYEDVEQGNDHDMDAIVRYEVMANAGNTTVTVNLTSEYAAGSADQNIGYIISGTTRDGIYLEVRDRDGAGTAHPLNTPPGANAGDCAAGIDTPPCNATLGLTANRTFTASTSVAGVTRLRDPLWYAAKYGGFTDANGNNLPDGAEWDSNGDLEPDNYFLVTNPLELRSQLTKAFDAIANQSNDTGSLGLTGARVGVDSFMVQPEFNLGRNSKDWSGNLSASEVNADGTLGDVLWNARAALPPASARTIITSIQPGRVGTLNAVDFQAGGLGATAAAQFAALGISNPASVPGDYGFNMTPAQLVAYLRGDATNEGVTRLRVRSSPLGDIVNSEPVISSPRNDYGYAAFDRAGADMFDDYADYVTDKRTSGAPSVAYVGANDGMVHAFNGTTGVEMFGYIPNGVLNQTSKLALPDARFDHRYYVDGQINITDAKNGGTWKTVMVGATAAGGRSIFGLDVSAPGTFSASNVMWEMNSTVDPDMGHTYGRPLVLPMEDGSWAAVFGNGFGGASSDPILYVVDVFSGAVIKKIIANDGDSAADTDFDNDLNDPYNGLGQISAIDTNADGKADTVYGGDLQGNVWKFDLVNASPSQWGVAFSGAPSGSGVTPATASTPLVMAEVGGERQPITGGIRVSRGPGGGVSVFFGTGRYFVEGDDTVPVNPQIQSFYGVLDNGTAAGNRTNLGSQTILEQVDTAGVISRSISANLIPFFGASSKRGWFLDLALDADDDGDLDGIGERFIGVPRIQGGKVFFATFTPAGDGCSPGGRNFLYGLDLVSGAGALSGVQTLPSYATACTGSNCGAVALEPASSNAPPVMSTTMAAVKPIVPIGGPGTCTPGTPGCPTFEQCQVVIYPGGLVLPRACGRQSWRQLR